MPKSLFPAATPEVRERLERSPTLKLVNDFDWSGNPLGPIQLWPDSVRGVVRMIMAASSPMVLLIGRDGILIYNDAYAAFAGNRHPEIFGMPVLTAWPEIADFNRHKIELGMAGEALVLRDQELVLNRHGSLESGWMDLHYSPILGEDGRPLGTLCTVYETTERVLAETALARSEERLSLALSGTNLVGTWDWDVAHDVVTADDRFAKLHGIDPLQAGIGVPVDQFLNAVHPEDRARVEQEITTAVANASTYRSEYRLVRSEDGRVQWVVASGRPRTDAAGRVTRFPGVVVDITEQKLVAEALAKSELNFRTLADTMPQMVWSTLPDGFHDYYNARWYEFTGMPVGSTDGEAWNGMFHPDDQERAWEAWRHSLNTGEPYQIEYRLRHHTGAYRWTLGLALPIRDDKGTIIRWFGTCTDINETKLVAEERELVAQELSHRIKNIFAVLTSIIGLSARGKPEVKPFADQLRQRIFALGEAHNFVRPHSHISRPELNQSSLWALIAQLLSPYQEDENRFSFVGSDAEIDDGTATPLALLFHELATNAAKYGALSVDGGHVTLTGEPHGDHYRLTWKEQGGPRPAPSDVKGFGSSLIALSVEGQMRGKLERIWEDDGLRIIVDLPITSLRRSARLQAEEPA
ncbi:PAS domain-containing protein [Devosia sp.]|uniref:PAS domain-containing protein n=1 Tax=Devosia sp. TaxID=1871048 RepID=UPI003265CB5B